MHTNIHSRFSLPVAPARHLFKTFVLGLVGVLAVSTAAIARDSTWLHGDNGHIAVNTLEHRSGDGRATDVALIYGSHLLQGTLTDADAGKVVLKEAGAAGENEGALIFTGTISVNYEKGQIAVKGTLATNDTEHTEVAKYNATIKCKAMIADQ